MTYLEWIEKNPNALATTGLDEATIGAIEDWFAFRYVCDNTKFERFFLREIKLHKWQYEQMLRLESVNFDPMVSNYVERWVSRTGSDKHEGNSKDIITNSGTSAHTGSNSSTSTPGVVETRRTEHTQDTTSTTSENNTETPNLTTTNSGSASASGNDNSNSKTVTDGSESGTNNTTHDGTNTSDDRAMQGVLPDSSAYATSGFPANMNWTYADSQNQGKHTGEDSSTDKNTTSRETEGTSTTTGSAESSTRSTSENTTKQTGNTTREGSSTTKNTGTNTDVDTLTRSGSDTSSGTINSKDENSSTSTSERNDTAQNLFEHTDKEIATGRSAPPQEMLEKARSYFLKMNAFDWFRKRLDICFLSVYNLE